MARIPFDTLAKEPRKRENDGSESVGLCSPHLRFAEINRCRGNETMATRMESNRYGNEMLFTIVPHTQNEERNSVESVLCCTRYSALLDSFFFFVSFYSSFGIGFRVRTLLSFCQLNKVSPTVV